MAGTVTGFQRPYTFRANPTYSTVGVFQAVTYVAGSLQREVEVPVADNRPPVGVVTYQHEDTNGATVAVQLDRIGEITAFENISFGDDIVVAAGGKARRAAGLAVGTKANVLGEAQNTVTAGEKVQVLIRPKAYVV